MPDTTQHTHTHANFKMAYKITHDASLSPTSARTKLHFLEAFYSTSDTESKHEEYVSSFTPDATLVMGSKVANGTDGTIPLHAYYRKDAMY